MSEKIEHGFDDLTESPVSDWFTSDHREALNRIEEEDTLRIRMFALDMAVIALPSLIKVNQSETAKLTTVRRTAAEFEKFLKGDN